MTCIVGLVHNETVYLGGDSAATIGWDMRILRQPKVARVGPPEHGLLIGGTGEGRTLDVARFHLSVPAHEVDVPVERWVATVLVDAIREAAKAAGYAQKQNEQEKHGGAYLVGYAGRLFQLDCDYGMTECADGYDAIGCGDSFARGALYANATHKPKRRVTQALEAAAYFSAGVRGPFTILSLAATPLTADTTPIP